jgi:hypothetical protein
MTWERSSTNENNSYSIDISGILDSGETCSSVALENTYGVTVGTASVTSAGVVTVPVTAGGDGGTRALVTTSASRVLPVLFAWRANYDSDSYDDYAD